MPIFHLIAGPDGAGKSTLYRYLIQCRVLLERVHRRVEEGRHDVPVRKILERYPRTLDYLSLAVKKVQLALLFDAADIDAGGPHLVVSVVQGQVQPHGPWLPAWAQRVLGPARLV